MDADTGIALVTAQQLRRLREIGARLDARGMEEGRTILDIVEGVGLPERGVPASDAARILGVTPQTVRNWVRKGVIAGWTDATTDHFFVAPGALASAAAMRHVLPDGTAVAITDDEIDAEINAVRAERRRLRGR